MKKPDWVQCRKTLDNIITKVKDPLVVERARQMKLQLDELENPRSADPNTLDPSENESNEEFNENEMKLMGINSENYLQYREDKHIGI